MDLLNIIDTSTCNIFVGTKNFYILQNNNLNIEINLNNVLLPFGSEKYNDKIIINIELENTNTNNNYHYSQVDEKNKTIQHSDNTIGSFKKLDSKAHNNHNHNKNHNNLFLLEPIQTNYLNIQFAIFRFCRDDKQGTSFQGEEILRLY